MALLLMVTFVVAAAPQTKWVYMNERLMGPLAAPAARQAARSHLEAALSTAFVALALEVSLQGGWAASSCGRWRHVAARGCGGHGGRRRLRRAEGCLDGYLFGPITPAYLPPPPLPPPRLASVGTLPNMDARRRLWLQMQVMEVPTFLI